MTQSHDWLDSISHDSINSTTEWISRWAADIWNRITGTVDLPDAPAVESRLGGLDRKEAINIPGLSEAETVRHYTRLSLQNYAIDVLGLFPLGSKRSNQKPLRYKEFLAIVTAGRSFSSLVDDNGSKKAIRELEKASQATQKLAKLYGSATSFYLPRRWRLWWHSNVSSKDKGDQVIENEEESEWQ